MSLRDALLKSGAVTKKQAKRTNRQLKEERRKGQAERDSKKELAAREARERRQELERLNQERLAARQSNESTDQVRRLRARQIVGHHQLRYKDGPARFHHLDGEGRFALKLRLPPSLAEGLRAGRLAVARLEQPYQDEDDYVLISAEVADRVPEVVVFRNAQAPEELPELQLLPADLPPPRLPWD